MKDKRVIKGTVQVRCAFPYVLTLACQESAGVNTALRMGLMPFLERLVQRARQLDDAELNNMLDVLCL